MDTIFPVDFDADTRPKYIVLIQSIREAVRSGHLKPGQKLPPVRELAWQMGITPGTVARAYKAAVEDGILQATTGRGTFVAEAAPAPQELATIYAGPEAGAIDLRVARMIDVGQDAMIRAGLRRAADEVAGFLSYPRLDDDQALREAVVDWIEPGLLGAIDADDVIMAMGAQHGNLVALQTLLRAPNPVMLADALSYPGFLNAARIMRAQLIPVEADAHGMRPDALAAAYRAHGGQVVLTSANVQNPSTRAMPLARREELASMVQEMQLQIIEDDAHRIAEPSAPSFRALVPERAWYVASLSKCFSATLRVGWIVAPRGLAGAAREVARSNCYGVAQPIASLTTDLFTRGSIAEIRAKVVAEVDARLRMAVNILGAWQLDWQPSVPFLWLTLPPAWSGTAFVMECARAGVQLRAADYFALPGAPSCNAVRITLNLEVPMDKVEVALRRVCAILKAGPQADGE